MSGPFKRTTKIIWLPILFSLTGLALALIGLAKGWFGIDVQSAADYCEAAHQGLIKQPVNSWSNAGFIICGWVIAIESRVIGFGKQSGPFSRTYYYPVFLAFVAILIGLGSFVFHASSTNVGLLLDISSMFLLSCFMLIYAIKRWTNLKPPTFLFLYLIAIVISYFFNSQSFILPGNIDAGSMIFGVFLISAAVLEILLIKRKKVNIDSKWALYFICIFLISVFIWTQSRTDAPWCDPDSLIQGHAIWHILDALCIYFIYKYYQSEKEAISIS